MAETVGYNVAQSLNDETKTWFQDVGARLDALDAEDKTQGAAIINLNMRVTTLEDKPVDYSPMIAELNKKLDKPGMYAGDINNLAESGFYFVSDTGGTPTHETGHLLVIATPGEGDTYTLTHAIYTASGTHHIRQGTRFSNGTTSWQAWKPAGSYDEERVTILESDIATAKSDVTALKADVATAKSDIVNIDSRLDSLENGNSGDAVSIQGKAVTAPTATDDGKALIYDHAAGKMKFGSAGGGGDTTPKLPLNTPVVSPSNMTSNTTPSPFKVTASLDAANAFKVFDNNGSTYWGSSSAGAMWIAIDLGAPYTVGEYNFLPDDIYQPLAWTFEGSNDGASWDILETVPAKINSGLVTKVFSNTKAYRHYKMNITQGRYGGALIYSMSLKTAPPVNNLVKISGDGTLVDSGINANSIDTTALQTRISAAELELGINQPAQLGWSQEPYDARTALVTNGYYSMKFKALSDMVVTKFLYYVPTNNGKIIFAEADTKKVVFSSDILVTQDSWTDWILTEPIILKANKEYFSAYYFSGSSKQCANSLKRPTFSSNIEFKDYYYGTELDTKASGDSWKWMVPIPVVGTIPLKQTVTTKGSKTRAIAFHLHGDQATETGAVSFIAPMALTITDIKVVVDTAPTGAALILDIKKNGTTIYTTQANRPTIADGATTATVTLPDVKTIAAGDKISIDIAQVGSTTPGANLTVSVTCLE